MRSSDAATIASVPTYCACRSRSITCDVIGRGLQAQLLADFLLDFRAQMRAGPHRAGNFSHRHLPRRHLKTRRVAAVFGVPVGDLQAEGDRLGVNSVRAADFGSVLEFPGAAFEHVAQLLDSLLDQLRSVANQQRLRGVHHVVGGKPVVQPARRFGIAHGFLHRHGEGDHVVADLGLDLVDAGHIDAGALAEASRPPRAAPSPASASVSVAASSTSSHL